METVLPSAQDAQNHIRVLTINKKRFVVGLRWRVVKAQRNIMKEIRRIGRQEKLDVVAIRQSDAIQAGFAPLEIERGGLRIEEPENANTDRAEGEKLAEATAAAPGEEEKSAASPDAHSSDPSPEGGVSRRIAGAWCRAVQIQAGYE